MGESQRYITKLYLFRSVELNAHDAVAAEADDGARLRGTHHVPFRLAEHAGSTASRIKWPTWLKGSCDRIRARSACIE